MATVMSIARQRFWLRIRPLGCARPVRAGQLPIGPCIDQEICGHLLRQILLQEVHEMTSAIKDPKCVWHMGSLGTDLQKDVPASAGSVFSEIIARRRRMDLRPMVMCGCLVCQKVNVQTSPLYLQRLLGRS